METLLHLHHLMTSPTDFEDVLPIFKFACQLWCHEWVRNQHRDSLIFTGTLGKHVTFRSDSVGFQILQCRMKKKMTTIQIIQSSECTERAGDYTGGIRFVKGWEVDISQVWDFEMMRFFPKRLREKSRSSTNPPSRENHHKRFYGCFRERTQPIGSCVWTNESWTVRGTGKEVPAVNFSGSFSEKSYPKPLFQIIYVLHPMKMTYRSVIASSTLPRGIFFQTVGFEDLLAMSPCQGSD